MCQFYIIKYIDEGKMSKATMYNFKKTAMFIDKNTDFVEKKGRKIILHNQVNFSRNAPAQNRYMYYNRILVPFLIK